VKADDDLPDLDAAARLALAQEPQRLKAGEVGRRPDVTVHQLRIFWAVAHSETLTKAAKQLGLAQPSLSQQLSKLEGTLGSKLFHRRSNEMALTEAGKFLLPRAETVLRNMQELEEGLQAFSGGYRATVRIAGITSVLRVLLPAAVTQTQHAYPDVDFDIQEAAPNDILELLYGRRVNIGLLAANSIAEAGVGFLQVPLVDDPYVLVVPDSIDLTSIRNPRLELPPAALAVLGRSIQFNFGTQHTRRVEDWYAEMLPNNRIVAQCRSFEVAIGLVRAGTGVCLAPALSTLMGGGPPIGVRLYKVAVPPRRLVALVPSQYRRQPPFSNLLDTLQSACQGFENPAMLPTPPFLDRPSLASATATPASSGAAARPGAKARSNAGRG
jgi:DNA-binding transcriptional LysR family regulator